MKIVRSVQPEPPKLTKALEEAAQRLNVANVVVCLPDTNDPRGVRGK
jgi:hypothetical protein